MEKSIEIVMSSDGQQVVSSRQVADNFGKDHKHTLEYIRKILTDENSAAKLFQETTYESRGKTYPMFLMNRDGFSLVAMGFNGKRALQWKLKYIAAFNQMEQERKQVPQLDQSPQLLQLQESFDLLTDKLDKIGLLKPMVNHRYSFEKQNVFYKNATGDDSPRGIHEACGDYFGFPVPYSRDIKITLRDYVLMHINNDMEIAVEELERFVLGITSETIVKSPMGHWVNLNGFGGNDYEWPKVLHEFNHKCAYCGRSDVPLIPEHIVPQSVMSREHPERVDLIGSIVCSCGRCNASKGKQDMELWYRKHPKFSMGRLQKIKKHQLMYSLEELK